MALSGSFSGAFGKGTGLTLRVEYDIVYTSSKYRFTATPYLDHQYTITTSSEHSGTVSCAANFGTGASGTFTSTSYSQTGSGSVKLADAFNIDITPSNNPSSFTITPSAIYNLNATNYNGVAVPSISATGNAIDVTPPTIQSVSFSNITATSAKVTLTSNIACSLWQYKIGSGSWTNLSNATGTLTTGTISGLASGATTSISFRARRADVLNYSATKTASVTTQGTAQLVSVTGTAVDGSSPSLEYVAYIYNTSYTYGLKLKDGSTTLIDFGAVTFSGTGNQNQTISLTSAQCSTMMNAMPNDQVKTFTLELSTTISGTTTTHTLGVNLRVTAANSAPAWRGNPKIYVDSNTALFVGDITDSVADIGVIRNVTEVNADTFTIIDHSSVGIAQARNGASIKYYYLAVGGVRVEGTNGTIVWMGASEIEGTSTDIIFGAVDTRGFEVTEVLSDVPIHNYFAPYWSKTNIARRNGYDAEIDFDIELTVAPLSIDVLGQTYSNHVPTTFGGYYKVGNDELLPIGSISTTRTTTTASYVGTPIAASSTPATQNVSFQIMAGDGLISAPSLTLTVPMGVPLIQIVDGKITINGDLIVNGTITQNP